MDLARPVVHGQNKTNVLLAVTVDGHWHAVDARTGALLWTRGPIDDRPLVETKNYNTQNADSVGFPDPVYLIEPVNEGNLFAYVPGEAVHRLPLTVKMLVEKSPGRLADGTIHVGSVSSVYHAMDVFDGGRILKSFSTAEKVHEDGSEDFFEKHQDCVLVGKVDYTVTVFQPFKGKENPRFSARLSVFAPGDHEELAEDGSSLDEYFTSNNGIVFKKSASRVRWIHKFMQPVVYLFETKRTRLGRLEAVPVQFKVRESPDLVHVGSYSNVDDDVTDPGSLYVLNSQTFPKYKPLRKHTVAQSELALSTGNEHLRFDAEQYLPGSPGFPECLLGQRSVSRPYHVPLLEGPTDAGFGLYNSLLVTILLAVFTILVYFTVVKRKKNSNNKHTRRIKIDDEQSVLGRGSHGTVVYKGTFENRSVAVKRVLAEYFNVVEKEVNLLSHSDHHPNVVRLYGTETDGPFVYIALELCPGNLIDLVENPLSVPDLLPFIKSTRDFLQEMTEGLAHLHQLGIVHGDLKPANILISAPNPTVRPLISDFGLSRKLEPDQSVFDPSTLSGSIGWRAPECMLREAINLNADQLGFDDTKHGDAAKVKVSRKMDIFSLGLLFYYVLSGGGHPFGDDPLEREQNIAKHDLQLLNCGIDPEGIDLILRMVRREHANRPECSAILKHPYFWPAEKRLAFLADVSDKLERVRRDNGTSRLLESKRGQVFPVQSGWHGLVDKALFDDLGKYRRYLSNSVQDLLRAMRNKRHHYQELPDHVKGLVGDTPELYYKYYAKRFPALLITVYKVIEDSEEWRSENPFKDVYYNS